MRRWWNTYSHRVLCALPSNRLLTLDVFRGLTIMAMVLVNNPGSWSYVYSPMLHANWHGYTPTDLIFPFFVFIVGVSISIVVHRDQQSGVRHSIIIKTAVVRTIKLLALGLFLAAFYYDFSDANYQWFESQISSIRIMGVLQRLGLVFFFTLLITLYFSKFARIIWVVGLLLGYWLALIYIPYLDLQGHVYQGLLLHGNSLAAWVDNRFLGAAHVYYQKATPFAFDPEGLLSTVPAIASGLIGVMIGELLLDTSYTLRKKVRLMLVLAITLLFAGHLLDLSFPINKSLWTSSFVLVSSGWALVVLALLTWVIDIKGWKRWSAPFVVLGTNAILFYLFSAVLARVLLMIPIEKISMQGWIYTQIYQPMFGSLNGSLAYAISFLCLSYLVMHWCYKKQLFLKI